jgi:type IV pilus assembly protein PilB
VHHDVLSKIIEKISKTSEQALNDLGSDDFDVDFKEEDVAAAVPDAQANEVDDAPIVKFLTKMLIDAINMGRQICTLNHLKNFTASASVLMASCGKSPSHRCLSVTNWRPASKLFLNYISENVPQDGRMKLNLGSKSIDFRVSTLPTLFGEKL